MTGNITVGVPTNPVFKPFKFSSAKWNRHRDNYTDTASFVIPAICSLKCVDGTNYTNVATGLQFTEGMPVQIDCGYDGNNPTRFKGFISRVNYKIPLEIECEGYSYQLRILVDFTRTYSNTTVKAMLADLIKGTSIKLSDNIPNIPITKAVFRNCTGLQVLDWLKEKCLLSVYFNFDTLYAGLREINVNGQIQVTGNVRHRLNWNVVKDNDLKFQDRTSFATVKIELAYRQKTGVKNKVIAGKIDGEVKKLRTMIQDAAWNKLAAEDQRLQLVNKGYEGNITAFLLPLVEPGMSDEIIDKTYVDRNGKYFVEGVSGELSKSGGRQKILIGNSL